MAGGGLFNPFKWKQDEMFDERFIMHRFKSTRLAVLVGTITMFAIFMYHLVAHETIRWDLIGVLAAMAAAKVCAMLYYRKTN